MRGTVAGIVALALTAVASVSAEPVSGGVVYVTGLTPTPSGIYMTRQTSVDFGTLDVAKPENAPAVFELLDKAATRVCTVHETSDAQLTRRIQTCRKHALAEAVAKLDLPEVSRLASNN